MDPSAWDSTRQENDRARIKLNKQWLPFRKAPQKQLLVAAKALPVEVEGTRGRRFLPAGPLQENG